MKKILMIGKIFNNDKDSSITTGNSIQLNKDCDELDYFFEIRNGKILYKRPL